MIFKSIKTNVKTLQDNNKVIQGVLNALQKFYLSLFKRRNGKSLKRLRQRNVKNIKWSVMSTRLIPHFIALGFFGSRGMYKSLANAPKVFDPESNRDRSSRSTTGGTRRSGKGLGRGSPNYLRKPIATKRQQRNQLKKDFTKRKQKTDLPTSSSRPPKKIAPRGGKKTDDGGESSTVRVGERDQLMYKARRKRAVHQGRGMTNRRKGGSLENHCCCWLVGQQTKSA